LAAPQHRQVHLLLAREGHTLRSVSCQYQIYLSDSEQVQKAINALSTTSTTAQSIFILAGTYNEQVDIPARKAVLTIYGYTTDTSSYAANVVNIQYSCSQADCASSNDATGEIDSSQSTAARQLTCSSSHGLQPRGQDQILQHQHKKHLRQGLSSRRPKRLRDITRLLWCRPLRLPGHPPRPGRQPVIRQMLHPRRHGLHLRPARTRLDRWV
jgi:hypothetical protein